MTAREQHEQTVRRLTAEDADRAKAQYLVDQHIRRWLGYIEHRSNRLRIRHARWQRWQNRFAR